MSGTSIPFILGNSCERNILNRFQINELQNPIKRQTLHGKHMYFLQFFVVVVIVDAKV